MNRLRREAILSFVEDKNVASIKELMEFMPDVSLMTIHRDLDFLESQGFLTKFRGGAKAVKQPGEAEYHTRLKENSKGKQIMASKAKTLLQGRNSIFLDAGTSNLFLARELEDTNLHIITTSPGIALELSRLLNPDITLCGGTLNRNNLSVSGQNTLEMLRGINIDIAFIGVSGCSLTEGFTCGTESDSFIKREIIRKARTSVLMLGEEKLKCLMPYTFAEMEDVDFIICDKELPDDYKARANEAGVKIL